MTTILHALQINNVARKEGKDPITPALTHTRSVSTLLNTVVWCQQHFQFALLSSAQAYS